MAIRDYFKPIDTMTAEQVREFLNRHAPDRYNLVDVRQPGEYRLQHLPGARLIPVAELVDRLSELDPAIPTITYCGSGKRSRAAASVLATAGFKSVVSMAGGIKAWQGGIAAGPPEAGMSFFAAAAGAEELIALAWMLEEGSRKFYAAVAQMKSAAEAAGLFGSLVKAEEHHKETLRALYHEITGREPDPDFPKRLPIAQGAEDRMEGNVSVSEALAWAEGKGTRDLLDLSLSLETDSYDLYIKMGRTVPQENAKKVFARLVAEEKVHLARMAELLDSITNTKNSRT
jgi:sulfur-carrier protein adenylyltransferase/sulfurtransferase